MDPVTQLPLLRQQVTSLLQAFPGRPLPLQQLPWYWMQHFQSPLDPRQYGFVDITLALRMCPAVPGQEWVLQKGVLYALDAAPVKLQQILDAANQHRAQLLSQAQFVSCGQLITAVCGAFQVDLLQDLGYGGPCDISLFRDTLVKEHRVTHALGWYLATRPVATLQDLEEYMHRYLDVPYSHLQLGDLAAHPAVRGMIGPVARPAGGSMPRVSMTEVLKAVVCIVEESQAAGKPANVSTADLKSALQRAYGYPLDMGVAILVSDTNTWAREVYNLYLKERQEVNVRTSQALTDAVSPGAPAFGQAGPPAAPVPTKLTKRGRKATRAAAAAQQARGEAPADKWPHGSASGHGKDVQPGAAGKDVPLPAGQLQDADTADADGDVEMDEETRAGAPPQLGTHYILPHKPVQPDTNLLKWRCAQMLHLRPDFSYSELFAHFRTSVMIMCNKTLPPTNPRLTKRQRRQHVQAAFTAQEVDLPALAERIFKEYIGAMLAKTDRKIISSGTNFWRHDLLLHMLLHLVWQFCRGEYATRTPLGFQPGPPSKSANLAPSEAANDMDVVVIDGSDDEGARDGHRPAREAGGNNNWGQLGQAGSHRGDHTGAIPGEQKGQLWGLQEVEEGGASDIDSGSVSRVCAALRTLQESVNGCKPPSGGQWTAQYTKRLRKLVRTQLGLSSTKLQALSIFLGFILQGSFTGLAVVPGPKPGNGEGGPAGEDQGPGRAVDEGGGQEGPALASAAELAELVRLQYQGLTLPALNSLEAALLSHFQVARFSQIGVGPTLLSFLQSHPGLAHDLGADQPAYQPLTNVLEIATQAAAAVGGVNTTAAKGEEEAMEMDIRGAVAGEAATVPAAVAQCLTRHFNVARVEQLGHGPVLHLLQLAREAGVKPSSSLRALHALLCGDDEADSPEHVLAGSGAQPTLGSLEQATRCLAAAPYLSDLGEWSGWEVIYAHRMGPLDQFIRMEGARAGIAAVQLPGGQLVKVPVEADSDAFVTAVLKDDPRGAAAVALTLVMLSGGVHNAPLALLASGMEHCLATLAVKHGHSADGAPPDVKSCAMSDSSLPRLSAFCLRFLDALPQQIRPALAPHLILRPLAAVLGSSSSAHEALLRACDIMPPQAGGTRGVRRKKVGGLVPGGALPGRDGGGDPPVGGDGRAAMDTGNVINEPVKSEAGVTAAGRGLNPLPMSSGTCLSPCNQWHTLLHHLGVACGVLMWQEHMVASWQGEQSDTATATSQTAVTLSRCSNGTTTAEVPAAGEGSLQPEGIMQGQGLVQEEGMLQGQGLKQEADTEAEPTGGVPTVKQEATSMQDAGADRIDPLQTLLARMAYQPSQVPQASRGSAGPATFGQPQSDDSSVMRTAVQVKQEEGGIVETAATGGSRAAQCRELVEQIRREEFGIGLDLADGPLKELRERQNARMGRALQRLSHELYSSDTHFVLELVQNADDNAYPGGCVPTLEFILSQDCIHVSNNEKGFSFANLRALCDVGASTKSKASGYIGHKGIGFKSVFRVTDAPEIYSNGFQVSFDLAAHQSLGYILPTWLPQVRPMGAPSRVGMETPATRVVLPVSAGHRGEGGEPLRLQFKDLHPTLLLFLQRLQCIAVQDTVSGATNIMLKRQLSPHVVELRHGDHAQHTSRWLTVSSSLRPTVERRGSTVSETRVALAFELDSEVPRQQAVFAFLPLRSYGLRFVVQADFVVPSSREAVDRDSAWNQMLREELGPLYARSLQSFLSLPPPAGRPHFWLDRWLACIPVDGEAQGFFAPLPHSIAARVRTTPCIPTETGALVCPCQAMVCDSPAIRSLVSGPLLRDALNAHVVHPDVQALYTSPALRSLLGVSEFSPPQIVQLLRSVCSRHRIEDLGPNWVAAMLVCVADTMEAGASSTGGLTTNHGRGGDSNTGGGISDGTKVAKGGGRNAALRAEVWSQLQGLVILPLEDGSFVAPKEVTAAGSCIFLPLLAPSPRAAAPDAIPASGQVSPSQPYDEAAAQLLHWMETCGMSPRTLRVPFVSRRLFEAVQDSPERTSLLAKALKALSVRELRAEDLLRHHILDLFQHPELIADLEDKPLAGLLAFPLLSGLLQERPVASEQRMQQQLLSLLSQHAQVVTNLGLVQPRSHSLKLHLPPLLGNPVDLVKALPPVKWLVLDECYAREYPTLMLSWRWLFTTAFGASDWLHFVHVPTILHSWGDPVGCHTYDALYRMYEAQSMRDTSRKRKVRTFGRGGLVGKVTENGMGVGSPRKGGPATDRGTGNVLVSQDGRGDPKAPMRMADDVGVVDQDHVVDVLSVDEESARAGLSGSGGTTGTEGVVFEVEDWQCPSFVQIVGELAAASQGNCKLQLSLFGALGNIMEANWEEVETKLQARWRVAGSGEAGWKSLPSSFCEDLWRLAWLPTVQGALRPPPSLVQRNPRLTPLLGNCEVDYLHHTSISSTDVLRTLRVAVEPSVQLVLSHLQSWSSKYLASHADGNKAGLPLLAVTGAPGGKGGRGSKSPSGPAWELRASLKQMEALYTFLADVGAGSASAMAQIQHVFRSTPVIWLPAPGTHESTRSLLGSFYRCSSCRFSDPAKVVEPLRPPDARPQDIRILEDYYPTLHHFFCGSHGGASEADAQPLVQATPTLEEYCAVLDTLTRPNKKGTNHAQQAQQVLKVFHTWAQQHKQGTLSDEDVTYIRAFLLTHQALPTTTGTWARMGKDLFVLDLDEALLPLSSHQNLAEQGVTLIQLDSTPITSYYFTANPPPFALPDLKHKDSALSPTSGGLPSGPGGAAVFNLEEEGLSSPRDHNVTSPSGAQLDIVSAGAVTNLGGQGKKQGKEAHMEGPGKDVLQSFFVHQLRIPCVSAVTQHHISTSGVSDYPSSARIQNLLQAIIPLAQRYIYNSLPRAAYDALAAAVAPVLQQLQCRAVQNIQLSIYISLAGSGGNTGGKEEAGGKKKDKPPSDHGSRSPSRAGSGSPLRGINAATVGGAMAALHGDVRNSPRANHASGVNSPAWGGTNSPRATPPGSPRTTPAPMHNPASTLPPPPTLKPPSAMNPSATIHPSLLSRTSLPQPPALPPPITLRPPQPPPTLQGPHARFTDSETKVKLHEGELLVQQSAMRMFHLMATEVARIFTVHGACAGVAEFLYLCMLGCEAGEDVEIMAKRRGLGGLDAGVDVWKVPAPPAPPPVPPSLPPGNPLIPPPMAPLPHPTPPPFPPPPGVPPPKPPPNPPAAPPPPTATPPLPPSNPPPPLPPPITPHVPPPPGMPPPKPPPKPPSDPPPPGVPHPKPPTGPLPPPNPPFFPVPLKRTTHEDTDLNSENSAPDAKRLRASGSPPAPPNAPPPMWPGAPPPGAGINPPPLAALPPGMRGRMAWDPQDQSSDARALPPGTTAQPPLGLPGPRPPPLPPPASNITPPGAGPSEGPASAVVERGPIWKERQTAAKAAGNISELSLAQVVQRVSTKLAGAPQGPSRSSLSRVDALSIGRYGEELVWHFLEADLKLRPGGFEVKWINQSREEGRPFDIVIKGPDGRQVFVEVKTSSAANKDSFEISYQELSFAQVQGDAYHIYRILDAGSNHPALVRLINPVKLWATNAIAMHVVI